ncbi:hypothetical protein FKM82_020894 [Ascaphus truei]
MMTCCSSVLFVAPLCIRRRWGGAVTELGGSPHCVLGGREGQLSVLGGFEEVEVGAGILLIGGHKGDLSGGGGRFNMGTCLTQESTLLCIHVGSLYLGSVTSFTFRYSFMSTLGTLPNRYF